jgi:flagellum-specific ATP synthase
MRGCSLVERVDACKARLRRVEPAHISGTVTNLLGLVVEVEGLSGLAAAGDGLQLHTRDHRCILAEVIGFRDAALQAMAYGTLDGVAHGSRALVGRPT